MIMVDPTITTIDRKIAEKLSDPVDFIESLLSFKGKPLRLYPFQKKIARNVDFLRDRIVIQKARQIGGSLLVAALLTYHAFTSNDAVFILVSKTAEQSGFIASYVRRFFDSNPILAEIVDRKKTNKNDLWLRNGTVVYNRTAGNEGENLRGISCEGKGAIVFDESAYIGCKAIRALIHVAHGCGEIHCSTPRRPKGYFYEICHSPDYKKFKIPASKSPRIPSDEIDRMRRLLRPSEFKTDVLGEFSAGENNVFDHEAIEKAIDHELPLFDCNVFDFGERFPFTSDPNKNYVYSLDTAKVGQDSWILTVGDLDRNNNTMEVVAYHAWAGTVHADDDLNVTLTDDPNTIIADILRYMNRFCCRKFFCDTTSNDYFAHVLFNQHLIPVEKVVWSLQKKERMIEHLATCLRAEKLAIPNDETMVNQLFDFSYDTKRMEDDSERKIYLRGGSDDHVASLAMLSQALTGERLSLGGLIYAW